MKRNLRLRRSSNSEKWFVVEGERKRASDAKRTSVQILKLRFCKRNRESGRE